MSRIPEAQLQRLKEEVSVQRLVEASGVELKKAGKEFLGRCPWHHDREASLAVTLPVPSLPLLLVRLNHARAAARAADCLAWC